MRKKKRGRKPKHGTEAERKEAQREYLREWRANNKGLVKEYGKAAYSKRKGKTKAVPAFESRIEALEKRVQDFEEILNDALGDIKKILNHLKWKSPL